MFQRTDARFCFLTLVCIPRLAILQTNWMESLTMIKVLGYTAKHFYSPVEWLKFKREEASANEIKIKVLCCGFCGCAEIGEVSKVGSYLDGQQGRFARNPRSPCTERERLHENETVTTAKNCRRA